MSKEGKVFLKDINVGTVWEDEEGFGFQYNENYLKNPEHGAISKTLPLNDKPYLDKNIIPFFDGLIPEGFLLDIAIKNWQLNPRDRMGLLLNACRDCIGAVHIVKIENE